jgi:hypothetical protein
MEKNLLSGLMQAADPTAMGKSQWVTPPGHPEPAIVEVRVRPLSVIRHYHPELRQAWIAWWEAAVRQAEHRQKTYQKFPGLFEEGGVEPYGYTPEVQAAKLQDGDLGRAAYDAEVEFYRLKEETYRPSRISAIQSWYRRKLFNVRGLVQYLTLRLRGRKVRFLKPNELPPPHIVHEERVQLLRELGERFPGPLRNAGPKESKTV